MSLKPQCIAGACLVYTCALNGVLLRFLWINEIVLKIAAECEHQSYVYEFLAPEKKEKGFLKRSLCVFKTKLSIFLGFVSYILQCLTLE